MFNYNLLSKFSFPQTVQVAIFIYGNGLVGTSTEHRFGFACMRQIDTHATILGLYEDKCDVMLVGHWVSHTAYLNLDMTIIDTCHNREMLLYTSVYGIHSKLLHLFATAYYGNT
jgi:hypothetical protein